jgi:hypothetical protein
LLKFWKIVNLLCQKFENCCQYNTNDISTQPKLNPRVVPSNVILVNHLKHKYTKKLMTDVLLIIIFFTYRNLKIKNSYVEQCFFLVQSFTKIWKIEMKREHSIKILSFPEKITKSNLNIYSLEVFLSHLNFRFILRSIIWTSFFNYVDRF